MQIVLEKNEKDIKIIYEEILKSHLNELGIVMF